MPLGATRGRTRVVLEAEAARENSGKKTFLIVPTGKARQVSKLGIGQFE